MAWTRRDGRLAGADSGFNDQLLIDNWTNHGNNLDTAVTSVQLTAGQR